MNKLKLKFSHDYMKLPENWEGTQAVLISVKCVANMENFKVNMPNLIMADTKFRGEEGFYPLTFKEGLLLTFLHLPSDRLFTTIRRYTPDKASYYLSKEGKTFELVKVEE